MDIHKPKPVHSWREFLSEIGVIVIGIAIALSGEQVLEWFHWRHEVAETRSALSEELAHDMGVYKFRMAQSECITRRVEQLSRYKDSWRTAAPLKLSGPITGPFLYVYSNDAWSAAQSSQSISHMTFETRIKYLRIYTTLHFLEESRLQELSTWNDLTQFDDARHLDEHDLMRLTELLHNARIQNAFYRYNGTFIEHIAQQLGVRPDNLTGNPAVVRQLCTPLIAAL